MLTRSGGSRGTDPDSESEPRAWGLGLGDAADRLTPAATAAGHGGDCQCGRLGVDLTVTRSGLGLGASASS